VDIDATANAEVHRAPGTLLGRTCVDITSAGRY
jgi:hypothetical protein